MDSLLMLRLPFGRRAMYQAPAFCRVLKWPMAIGLGSSGGVDINLMLRIRWHRLPGAMVYQTVAIPQSHRGLRRPKPSRCVL